MSYDYKPTNNKPNPMERKAFNAMEMKNQAEFIRLGGIVFDAPVLASKEPEYVVSKLGSKMLLSDFHALPLKDQSAFILGE